MINALWAADEKLFAAHQIGCLTSEEFNFFQNMRFKEESEPTLSNDLIMSEDDNSLGIYIVRVNYDEYMIGCTQRPDGELYAMNLSEALSIKLKDIGIDNCDKTLGEWLQSINYKGVKYNRNYDNF